MLTIKLKWIAIATAIALAMVILPTFFGWNPSPLLAQPITQHTRPVESRHILFGFRLVRE